MQGEIFEEIVENLTLQAQEEQLNQLKMNYKEIINKGSKNS